jgi:predicted MPP superfamily phosphohydrolase
VKTVLKRVALALGALVVVLLLYGVAVEPRLILDERRYRAEIPGLGVGWRGAEVAVVADFQVGMWLDNTGMVDRAVEQIVEAEPAAALLGGDFLYGTGSASEEEIETVLDALEPLTEAGIPTFAVLGNHDYAVGAADELRTALEARGIDVLRNEAVPVPSPRGGDGPPLHVVGLGPVRPGLADAEEALDGLPRDAPRVVLMHNPTAFPTLPPGSAPLAVAGHTHCGQIALPGFPRWSYLALTAEEEVVADGFAPRDYGPPGNRLFVTCGIGFSLVPVRINAPPQVVFFELT